jgi:hypothetical protein
LWDVEVEKQSKLISAKLHVREQLRIVNWSQFSYRFHLYDNLPIDKQVDSVAEIDANPIVQDGQRELLHYEVALLSEFMNEASLVGALEQTGPKCPVDLDCGTHNGTTRIVELHAAKHDSVVLLGFIIFYRRGRRERRGNKPRRSLRPLR